MFLRKRPEIILLLLLGVIPLLWFLPGSIIGKGDTFPYWLNPHETLKADVYLWDLDNTGGSNFMSTTIPHGIFWLIFLPLGFDAGLIQIITQVLAFMGGGLGAYYLSKKVYPDLRLAPLATSIFYMFNFFVLQSRLNLGFVWTYALLPLLIAVLMNIITATLKQNNKETNKNIIYFAIISTLAFSLGNANPSNVVIILLVLAAFLLYYMITRKDKVRPLFINLAKLIALTVPFNIWWVIPTLNYFLWSSSSLTSQVNVVAWGWTHARASFLNLFWLNGQWGWLPEYVPYINSYSNPALLILTFFPFILAGVAILFKTNKSKFNIFLLLMILVFVFLAKGIHEPLSQLNLLLYIYIPGMNMFREAATKFTLAFMPFLALLVGYAIHHATNKIANGNLSKHIPKKAIKLAVITFFLFTFVMSSFPLITNPIEAKTTEIPFSSYVTIPDYWYSATNWLNNRGGDYRILITPPNDFYMMPYTWGYFGADEWVTRFIQKPIITYYFGYSINNETFNTIDYLYNTIEDNKASEFKAFLDLLGIRYILQRNDLCLNVAGREVIPPDQMQAFLLQQPYLRLVERFGQLDIYEYTTSKPSVFILNSSTPERTTIKIENITESEGAWNFSSLSEIQEWKNVTNPDQWQNAYTITYDNGTLKAELGTSSWGWKAIKGPIISAQYGSTYPIQLDVRGQNAYQVHIKTIEFDEKQNSVAATYIEFVNDGTFDWQHISYSFEPTNETTKYIQIQIWHGHETDKPLPNIIWVDNVQITSFTKLLNTTGLDLIFPNTTPNQPATILNYQKINPTKITARVNATQPFIIATSEALDSSWTAYANGKQYKPIPLYLGLKGFYINQTGLFDIAMEYEPQKWFYYGSIISVTTLLVCITYLVYGYAKDKNIWNQIRKIRHRRKTIAQQTR